MNVSRDDYNAALRHWRELGLGTVDEWTSRAREGREGYKLATLTRTCRQDEALHVGRWVEVQALLCGGFYLRTGLGETVRFALHVSRALDASDSALLTGGEVCEVIHGA